MLERRMPRPLPSGREQVLVVAMAFHLLACCQQRLLCDLSASAGARQVVWQQSC